MRALEVGRSVIRIHRGDITKLGHHVGAIVNPASEDLRPALGICAAIHEAGGREIAVECLWNGRIATGQAVATTAGRLQAECVIHAVGPVWDGGLWNEDKLLASAYRSALELAAERKLRSIACPALSTGILGFPIERTSSVAIGTVAAFLKRGGPIEEVILVAHTDDELAALVLASDRWERMQAARMAQAPVVR